MRWSYWARSVRKKPNWSIIGSDTGLPLTVRIGLPSLSTSGMRSGYSRGSKSRSGTFMNERRALMSPGPQPKSR